MAALIVSAAGHVVGPTAGEGVTSVDLYVSVTRAADGTPVTGLSGSSFSIKLFISDPDHTAVDVTTMVPELDENGDPVLDDNGNPTMNSVVRPTAQPGVYFSGGAMRGRSGRAFLVRVQAGGDQGEAVGAAIPFVRV